MLAYIPNDLRIYIYKLLECEDLEQLSSCAAIFKDVMRYGTPDYQLSFEKFQVASKKQMKLKEHELFLPQCFFKSILFHTVVLNSISIQTLAIWVNGHVSVVAKNVPQLRVLSIQYDSDDENQFLPVHLVLNACQNLQHVFLNSIKVGCLLHPTLQRLSIMEKTRGLCNLQVPNLQTLCIFEPLPYEACQFLHVTTLQVWQLTRVRQLTSFLTNVKLPALKYIQFQTLCWWRHDRLEDFVTHFPKYTFSLNSNISDREV